MIGLKATLRNLRDGFRRASRKKEIRRAVAARTCRIVVGSGGIPVPGWIPTEKSDLDLLDESSWTGIGENSIQAVLAEHVWEHLTEEEGLRAAKTCFKYLEPAGYLRVAVPDGLHPDPAYIAQVKPGGSGPGAEDHKVLYTHRTLSELFKKAGFEVSVLEYFDEDGIFQFREWDPTRGKINRSKRFDPRNQGGELKYTSLIVDAVKPGRWFTRPEKPENRINPD